MLLWYPSPPILKKVLDSFIKMLLHRTLQNIDTNEKYHYSFVLSQLCLPVINPAFLNVHHFNWSKSIESKYIIHYAGVYFIIKFILWKSFQIIAQNALINRGKFITQITCSIFNWYLVIIRFSSGEAVKLQLYHCYYCFDYFYKNSY